VNLDDYRAFTRSLADLDWRALEVVRRRLRGR
jgi:hypothetical protein